VDRKQAKYNNLQITLNSRLLALSVQEKTNLKMGSQQWETKDKTQIIMTFWSLQ